MNIRNIINSMRLSSRELILFYICIIAFILLFVATVISFVTGTAKLGAEFLALMCFLTALWFVPFIRKTPLMQGFVWIMFAWILYNIALGPELVTALEKLGRAKESSFAIETLGETNRVGTRTLEIGTPLYEQDGSWTGNSIKWKKNLPTELVVQSLGKSLGVNGINYSLILLPRKDTDTNKYMPNIFDSTSEKWWVPAENLKKIETAAEAKDKKANELKAAGWVNVLVSKPDSQGFSSVTIPKDAIGKKIVNFKTCLYTQTRSNGTKSETWAPRKLMVFPAELGKLFVDVKFTKVPANGVCRAKFR